MEHLNDQLLDSPQIPVGVRDLDPVGEREGLGRLALVGMDARGESAANLQSTRGLAEVVDLVQAVLARSLVAEAGSNVNDTVVFVDVEAERDTGDVVVAECHILFWDQGGLAGGYRFLGFLRHSFYLLGWL